MRKRGFLLGVVAVAASIGLLGGVAGAATVTVSTLVTDTVNPYTNPGWVKTVRDAGVVEIADDYGAPAGFGSSALVLDTTGSNDKATVFKSVVGDGLGLSDVSAIGYTFLRSSASTAPGFQAPSLNIEVDVNGAAAGGFTTLVYEPVYNDWPSNGPAIPTDTWIQTDAFEGGSAIWWSTRDIPGATAFSSYVTWASLATLNPDAVILRVGVNQGGGNAGLFSAVDALTYNGTTYDFEAFVPTKDDCKNGGWATLFPSGTYKNQGQCVAAFARLD